MNKKPIPTTLFPEDFEAYKSLVAQRDSMGIADWFRLAIILLIAVGGPLLGIWIVIVFK